MQANQCGAILITYVSFTSNQAFYVDNVEKKIDKKNWV